MSDNNENILKQPHDAYKLASDGFYYAAEPETRTQREFMILDLFDDISRFSSDIEEYTAQKFNKDQIPIDGLCAEFIKKLICDYSNHKIPLDEISIILYAFQRARAIKRIDKKKYVQEKLKLEKYQTYSNSVYGNSILFEKGDRYDEVMSDIVNELDEQFHFGESTWDSFNEVSPDNKVKRILTGEHLSIAIELLKKENQTALDNGGQEKINEHLRSLQQR